MLYPTPNTFTPSSSFSLSSLYPQVVEMEPGFGGHAVVKLEDGGAAAETDFVDDLLDFSNAALIEEPEEEKPKQEDVCVKEETAAVAVLPPVKVEFEALPVDGLSVPEDDMESLEWLSHFVDDSFSEYSLTRMPPPLTKSRQPETGMVMVQVKPDGLTPVQTKARTKRARTGGRVWSLGSALNDSSSSSTSSSSTTTSFSSPLSLLLYPGAGFYQPAESPAKRRKRKPDGGSALDGGSAPDGGLASQPTRRCHHCGVQKTPQWRSGPAGSKTLCNACGVRYKSGRLLPEYRPACSPSYSEQLHSNNHRKVMEMRRKKDGEENVPGPLVQSF